jgi:hypothetical protein
MTVLIVLIAACIIFRAVGTLDTLEMPDGTA